MTLACARTQPQVIIVTATPQLASVPLPTPMPTLVSAVPTQSASAPTLSADILASGQSYTVRPGDTLSSIAAANGVLVEALAASNGIENPNLLSVGQVLQLPAPPSDQTPAIQLISDTLFVRTRSAIAFDVRTFIEQQPGYIRTATDTVNRNLADGRRIEEQLDATAVVQRVATEFSVDPRLLLALLEYRAGWLTSSAVSEDIVLYPMGEVNENREGLYRQLAWAADQLNAGYYGWRYRDLSILQFEEGERLLFNPSLNAGTVGLQYFLSLNTNLSAWQQQVGDGGFKATYTALFGDSLAGDGQQILPPDLEQPQMTLPFAADEVWFYTGGPHGGWGRGSAWSAVDFAPPDERAIGQPACYTSAFPVRAVASGTIVRSEGGSVVLDLDEDGNETTGWTVLYLHIASDRRVSMGTRVRAGDVIGYASCEGGFSTATHLHIARRYNGEWVPSYCHNCEANPVPPFVMSDWTVIGFENQEYQGIILRGQEQRQAEQGRQNPINRVAW